MTWRALRLCLGAYTVAFALVLAPSNTRADAFALRGQTENHREDSCSQSMANSTEYADFALSVDASGHATLEVETRSTTVMTSLSSTDNGPITSSHQIHQERGVAKRRLSEKAEKVAALSDWTQRKKEIAK